MGIYAGLADCTDPVAVVEESDLDAADRTVLALLRNKGIDPTQIVGAEGLALLRDFAVADATASAARRLAVEGAGDSVMWSKHKGYTQHALSLGQRINRESLGLALTGSGASGYGSIPLGRG
jgi:hypothetical protein